MISVNTELSHFYSLKLNSVLGNISTHKNKNKKAFSLTKYYDCLTMKLAKQTQKCCQHHVPVIYRTLKRLHSYGFSKPREINFKILDKVL